MSLQVRAVRELVNNHKDIKLKMLVYSPSGYGKTMFASTAPKACIAACELGHGSGTLSIASTKDEWPKIVEPSTFQELEQFCSGNVCPEAETLVLDGFSYAVDSIVKDYALTISRSGAATRAMGIPDLSDYQTISELERRLLARLLMQNRHIVVTAWEGKYQPPDKDRQEKMGSADLPGAMRNGAAALFDTVLRLQMRSVLRNPKDPASRYYERFWQTTGDGKYLAKCRMFSGGQQILPAEVPFDLDKGTGTFQHFLDLATEAYGKDTK